ncbi:MAG: hypothetical protein JXA67_16735 [Micromonosporaceae bacterium]|nr:hypothetical protein [Micromonosporaceae bacterium]
MVTWLLDISNHQDNFKAARVFGAAAEGYSGIIDKATEGRTFNDARFDATITAIQNAGPIPGAHHLPAKDSGQPRRRYSTSTPPPMMDQPDGWWPATTKQTAR